MSRKIYKLLTDEGDFFVGYDNTIDQFITPAKRTQREVAKPLGLDESIINDRNYILDLRRDAVHAFTLNLVKLKSGGTLTHNEIWNVDRFAHFLQGTVASHQYKYVQELEVKIQSAMVELGLATKYPDADWWEMVTDHAMYPAFQDGALAIRFPHVERSREISTPEQNKLAGRYLSYLTEIAGLVGPGKSKPTDVINKFYTMMRKREPGT